MSHKDEFPEFPRRRQSHAFREVGEEGGLVVMPADSRVQVLNPVGSKIFSMLDGQHHQSAIIKAIVGEFEVTEEDARRDLNAFLRQLQEAEMLEPEVAEAGVGGAKDE